MKKYDGKNAWWLILVFAIYNLLPLCIFMNEDSFSLSNHWRILILVFYYGCNLIWIPGFLRNRVELFDGYFIFYYGFHHVRIEISDILKIEKSRSLIASSANSLDKIYIVTMKKDLCISLKQNDEFIEEIKNTKKLE